MTPSLSIHFIDTSSTYPISQLKCCEIAKTDLRLSCDIIFNVFVWVICVIYVFSFSIFCILNVNLYFCNLIDLLVFNVFTIFFIVLYIIYILDYLNL